MAAAPRLCRRTTALVWLIFPFAGKKRQCANSMSGCTRGNTLVTTPAVMRHVLFFFLLFSAVAFCGMVGFWVSFFSSLFSVAFCNSVTVAHIFLTGKRALDQFAFSLGKEGIEIIFNGHHGSARRRWLCLCNERCLVARQRRARNIQLLFNQIGRKRNPLAYLNVNA